MAAERGVFTLGHSPDPDDAFMFYAMAENKIDLRGYRFEHRLEDIQTLNERALRGEHGGRIRADPYRKTFNAQRPTSNVQRDPSIRPIGGARIFSRQENRGSGEDDECISCAATFCRRV